MQIFFERNGRKATIRLQGELDHHAAAYVKEHVDSFITTNNVKNYLLDLTDLNFMDSSGIGVIIGRYQNIKALGGQLCIACKKPQIEKILAMSGIDKLIPLFRSAEEAEINWEDKPHEC